MKLNNEQISAIESQLYTYKIGAYFNEDGDVVNNLLDTVRPLQQEVQRLRKVVEFYSSIRKAAEFYSSKGCIVQDEWLSKMYEYVAKIADEALAYGSEVESDG